MEIVMKRIWLILLLTLTLVGCRTYVPVETTRTEYRDRERIERDTVSVRDSITTFIKGDTVLIDKWHTVYKELVRRDSIYIAKHDTATVTKEVIKVKKETNWAATWIIAGLMVLLGIAWKKGWIKKLINIILKW